ncbi:MAG TPA: RagB/SusD family nutrient uptake outer membrane protein, partial [Isosphaeraceae bacterium]|nr:RagB/SusD family nutrient uptake outer membrane protein [Isosphaeraceae bacterium]
MNRLGKRTLIGIVVLTGAAYGCKDYLTTPPLGALNEQTLGNQDGLEATLVGAYRLIGGLINFGSAPSNWAIASVPSDDAYKGSDPTDQGPQINPLEFYQWNNGPDYLNEKWNAMYEGVSRANATLRLLPTVKGLPAADAASIQGEALFLRAHFHFELWEAFGNIPYYKEDDTDFRKPNLQSADVIKNILADLDQAISLLPDAPRHGDK